MPIKLDKFGDAWNLADPSPFCLKLESFLKETKLAYEIVPFDPMRTFVRVPKGKLPFIENDDGSFLGDSTLIVERLSKQRGIDLDMPLSDRQRAISLAFRRMLDEHLYWVGVYSRWFDEPGWSIIHHTFFSKIPVPLRPFIGALARRRIAAALRAQGIGRHSREDISALGLQDMQALSQLLGDHDYFLAAEQPTLLDLWAHAFIGEVIAPPIESPLKRDTLALTNLVDHFQCVQDRLYV